jgi:hypothetical protein
MAASRVGSLTVLVSGTRLYIEVPCGKANALHTYLRTNNVQSSPPEPYLDGVDNIELAKFSDVKAVQRLLDKWK